MMKKIISLISVFAVILGFTPAFASDTVYDAGLLAAIGIIKSEKPEYSAVTRLEFADMLCFIENGAAGNGMEAALSRGYLSRYADGTDGASYPILWREAAEAIIKLLGYDKITDAYSLKAQQLGLFAGLDYSASTPLCFGEAVRLIENALETDVMEPASFGENVSYEVKKDYNLLAKYFDIYIAEGIVNGACDSYLGAEERTVPEGRLLIDGEEYYYAEDSVSLLGYKVKAYYCEPKGFDDKTIIYLKDKTDNVLSLSCRDIEKTATKSSFSYTKDDKLYTLKISGTADLVYNGKSMNFTNNFPLYIPDSEITFIDNNGDGTYEVVRVSSYVNYYISNINKTNLIIKDSCGQNTLHLDSAERLNVYKDGKKISFSELKTGMLISVMADKELVDSNGFKTVSPESEIFNIYVNAGKVTGTVTNVLQDDDKRLVIDGAEYYQSKSIDRAVNLSMLPALSAGDSAVFYTDVAGNIAYYEIRLAGVYRYAYPLDLKKLKDNLDSRYKIKLFTESGSVEIFSFADKLDLDGDRVEQDKFSPSRLLNDDGTLKGELIKYKLNRDGEISGIDTVYLNPGIEDEKTSLVKSYDGTAATLYFSKSAGNVFGGKVILGDSPKVFVIPQGENADDDDYQISDESYFGTSGDFYVSSYDAESMVSNIIVVNEKSNFNNASVPMVVSGVLSGVTEAKERCSIIKGFVNGTETEIPVKPGGVKIFNGNSQSELAGKSADDLKPGDVIRYNQNKNGTITSVQFIFSASAENEYKTSGSNYDSSYRTAFGRAYSQKGSVTELCYSDDLNNTSANEAFILNNMTVYELKNNKIYTAGPEIINTYKPAKDSSETDKVFIYTNRSQVRLVLVIH